MKNSLMDTCDKIHFRKRSIIETVNDQLKNIGQVAHSWHRSVGNYTKDTVKPKEFKAKQIILQLHEVFY